LDVVAHAADHWDSDVALIAIEDQSFRALLTISTLMLPVPVTYFPGSDIDVNVVGVAAVTMASRLSLIVMFPALVAKVPVPKLTVKVVGVAAVTTYPVVPNGFRVPVVGSSWTVSPDDESTRCDICESGIRLHGVARGSIVSIGGARAVIEVSARGIDPHSFRDREASGSDDCGRISDHHIALSRCCNYTCCLDHVEGAVFSACGCPLIRSAQPSSA
jgi:hypothetical protein